MSTLLSAFVCKYLYALMQGKDCFICKGGDHRAKDCPKKFKRCAQASELCLKCGASAHTMLSCNNDYSHDDLKEIQCYVCKRFGHLCCVDYFDGLLSEASCYKCGQSGHNGQGRSVYSDMHAEGHREKHLLQVHPPLALSVEKKGILHVNAQILPWPNIGPVISRLQQRSTLETIQLVRDSNLHHRTLVMLIKRDYTMTMKVQIGQISLNGGGVGLQMTLMIFPLMVAGGLLPRQTKKHKIYGLTSGSHGSNSHSSNRWGKYSSGASSSQGYANGYQHRFSASRFGNSNSNGMRRNHDWW
ncbi:Zinc finger CCHC domain-containing protein 9 [Bienertia sinuspersici]